MRKLFAAVFALFSNVALAQQGGFYPWIFAYPAIGYDFGGLMLPSTVQGGAKGIGTLNLQAIYINGVLTIGGLYGPGLPIPSSSVRGGVLAKTCSTSNWFKALSSVDGSFSCAQPNLTDIAGSLACSQTPALTGDVTTTAGSCATTITNNAVTNAKAAQMAAGTVKSNVGGGAANPSDNTPSAILDVIGSTRGSILYRGASGWAIKTPGTSGLPYVSNGAGADPDYQALDISGGAVTNTLPIGKGGTGQTTQQAAINALTGTQANKKYGRSDGTNFSISDLLADDLKGLTANPAAGYAGEYIPSSIAPGSAVPLTASGTAYNITSVSLAAGIWLCSGNAFSGPAAGTTETAFAGWFSTVSATVPTFPAAGGYSQWKGSVAGNVSVAIAIASTRFVLATTTTVYLSALSVFSGSTNVAYGFIGCERR